MVPFHRSMLSPSGKALMPGMESIMSPIRSDWRRLVTCAVEDMTSKRAKQQRDRRGGELRELECGQRGEEAGKGTGGRRVEGQ